MGTSDLTAPAEGAASSSEAIADELAEALLAVEHVDYNALTADQLRDLLDARETLEALCLTHRRRQDGHSGQSDSGVSDE